jgi:hypothetical protein
MSWRTVSAKKRFEIRRMAMWVGMGTLSALAAACAPSPRAGAVCPVSRAQLTSATVSAPAGPSRSAPAPAARPAGFEVRSDCPQRVRLFYGDKPGESSGTLVHLDPGDDASLGPRRDDGTQRVWLVDDRERALGDVTVSAATRRVEVDAACGALRAL